MQIVTQKKQQQKKARKTGPEATITCTTTDKASRQTQGLSAIYTLGQTSLTR